MHETAKRLYEAAEKLHGIKNQAGVGRLVNVSPQVVANWEKRGMSKAGMIEASNRIGCSILWLEKGIGSMVGTVCLDNNIEPASNQSSYVPLVSWVQAGNWEIPLDDRDKYDMVHCPIKQHSDKTFALTVRGISMHNPKDPKSFEEGDTIFVDPCREAVSGSFVVAMHDGSYEATFKQLIIEDNRKYLHALNPEWKPNLQEITQETYICGVVIARIKTTTYV